MKFIREDTGMNDLHTYLSELCNERLYQMILSNPREKDGISRIKIRPVMVKQELMFQETCFQGTQVFHKNYQAGDMVSLVERYMEDKFRQLEAWHMEGRLHVLVSKKGRTTIKFKATESEEKTLKPVMEHNSEKHYILKEGIPVPFLIDLGVQTPEGKIVHARYDKFKQINRYLEFVEDILPTLQKKGTVHIIDFGCGKSYLTFALYYYLHELKGQDVAITGLDLKQDVIRHCNDLARSYGYEKLQFLHGNIAKYEGCDEVDMVVTLHACDTATDYALQKAMKWNAKVIFSVPCCQHEVNRQIQNDILEPVLKYGILKERMAAIITDAVRAETLEMAGYDTQILEFIDMEHTPKNLLIRAVKRNPSEQTLNIQQSKAAERRSQIETGLSRMTQELHIHTTLHKLMEQEES